MRKLLVLLLATMIFGQQSLRAQSTSGAVEFGNIESKVLSGPDTDGDVWFSVKVEVRNEADTERYVDIKIRGVDQEGFEVVELDLTGAVKVGQKRILTDSNYVNAKSYKTIVKWEIED